ncbi:hypothetical protein ACFC09_35275 [Streptomyces sp. NPDC056161]|uniref:hypothetical protein n=1 Tax=Streptomyces sp. NPDC056161 TaxID=3345732 RepID=UPI0035E24E4A
MAKDLRALFSSSDRQLEAAEAFTHRQGQWTVVQKALSEHIARVTASAIDAWDLEALRPNLLVFQRRRDREEHAVTHARNRTQQGGAAPGPVG